MRFYNTHDDIAWLKATALRHTFIPVEFKSFTLEGNEDCPTTIQLFADVMPNYDTSPLVTFTLDDMGVYNLIYGRKV